MKKNLLMRFRSIRTSIIFSFAVLIVFALMVFLVLSLRFTRETVLENSTEYTSQLIGQVNNDIDSYMGYLENISLIVAGNSDVRDYLSGQTFPQERQQELKERIAGVFKTITDTRSDIVNIALLPRTSYHPGKRPAESLYPCFGSVLVSGGGGGRGKHGSLLFSCAECYSRKL